jgi:hypothetical protein
MASEHELHQVVGKLISEAGLSGSVLADPACGGKHRLPLFCNTNRSWKTELCNVDMLILKSNRVKVIVEVEESNVKPVQICGKFLASALCSDYIHRNEPPLPMDDSVLFIQILDTSELKPGTAKIDQWKTIAELVQQTIPVKDSKIQQYMMVYGDQNEFVPTHGTGRALTSQIEDFLTTT